MKHTFRPFSRRDFIRFAGLSLLGIGIEPILSACRRVSAKEEVAEPMTTVVQKVEPAVTKLSPTEPFSPTSETASLNTTEVVPHQSSRDNQRLSLIEKYGPATKALALEFHGDLYWFFDGNYTMDTDTFSWLMHWFQENEVWSANDKELLGFLDGTLQLPSRSVILTTDSGRSSVNSIKRMIPILQDTGMHFISFIWTMQMEPNETAACPDNLCWKQFQQAQDSGVFSFGTHSEYHLPLAEYDQEFGFEDLSQSIQEIENNIGVTPQLLSWPLESCPLWGSSIAELGIKAAFGGPSRPFEQCSVYAQDPLPYCLPRLLPPNRQNRLSPRPAGMSIDELAANYMDGFGR